MATGKGSGGLSMNTVLSIDKVSRNKDFDVIRPANSVALVLILFLQPYIRGVYRLSKSGICAILGHIPMV